MAAEQVESRPEAAASKPKGRGLSIVMVAILMSVEGAGVFFATRNKPHTQYWPGCFS